MKVAIVHDWTIHMRGGEKVLEAIAEIFPQATLYTLFYDREHLSPSLKKLDIRASYLQRFPNIKKYYRWLLPILPHAIQSLEIDADTDLVISSSHCVAKGIPIPAGARHICYCHAPMRYIWGFEKDYFQKFPFFVKPFLNWVLSYLRRWDLANASQVDEFIANSENIRGRIREIYKREASVLHPPLNTQTYHAIMEKPGNYYLAVSAFVPYKKLDIVIEAFNDMDRKLLVVGKGPMETQYRKLRRSQKISFLTSVPDEELRRLYSGAKALIFPTNEDFGIVPLEAQACGAPVIAYKKGGALETVKVGIFFDEQTPEAIRNAVSEFEKREFNRVRIPQSVAHFDKTHFKANFQKLLKKEPVLEHVYS